VKRGVIIGESHTVCLAEAARQDEEFGQAFDILRLQRSKGVNDSEAKTLDELEQIVADLPAQTPVYLSMLGTYHNILGLLNIRPEYDFMLDADDVVDAELRQIVPLRAVVSAFDSHITRANSIKRIKQAAKGQVYLLASPPPKSDTKFVVDRLLSMKKLQYHGHNIAEVGVNDPLVRLKLWKVESTRIQNWANQIGIYYVHPPKYCFCEAGFLDRPYYAEDATHANAEYGKLVLTELLAGHDALSGRAMND